MDITPEGATRLFHTGQYEEAAKAYSECLKQLVVSPKDNHNNSNAQIALLFNRAACNFKLKKYEKAIEDYDTILNNDNKNVKALAKKCKSLSKCGKFIEALDVAKQWQEADPKNTHASEEIRRLEIVVRALQEQDNDDDDDDDITPTESALLASIQPDVGDESVNIPPANIPNGINQPQVKVEPNSETSVNEVKDESSAEPRTSDFNCSYCNIKFTTQAELKTHCRSDLHKKKIVSDEGRQWKYRDPPRGLTSEEYTKCPRYFGDGTCRFSSKCSQAHSDEELTEWKERFEYKRQQLQKAKESELHGNTFADTLMEKWMNSEAPETVMGENIPGVKVYANSDLSITMSSKKSAHAWIFTLTSRLHLDRVVLLDDSTIRHFHISSITIGPKKNQRAQKLEDHCQEWANSNPPNSNTTCKNETVYRVKVSFRTDIYGTFRQTIIFDFGNEPVLCQNLCVDSNSVADFEKLAEDLIYSENGRWEVSSKTVIKFEPAPQFPDPSDQELMGKYPCPSANQIAKSESLLSSSTNAENYKQRMHDLLAIEEMAQFSSIAKYNVKTVLHLTNRFMLMPSAVSTAKYAVNGELFAQMELSRELSEDTSHGRLILQNVHSVLLAPYNHKVKNEKEPTTVHEALVEDRGKTFIFLRLSNKSVTELGLKNDRDIHAQVQFVLNRSPSCEMHLAVDRLPDTSTVFPDVSTIPNIPWTPQSVNSDSPKLESDSAAEADAVPEDGAKRQWSENLDTRLNIKQKEAVVAITTVLSFKLPPVLLIGPYGTGKTFTLAQAALQILRQPNTKILICTHSNSAADLYIKDYFHPYVEEDHEEAKPLRIMFKYRWMNTVSTLIQKYCLVQQEGHSFHFRSPTKEDVDKHRIIVTTLSTSRSLYDLGLEKDCFTHILIDEAAQAVECETIMPLALAGENTRIVLAGDHMQMSPEVHSDFARQHGFHVSLLERLFDMYPGENPCKILLCENYRSHKAIIDFTSDLFYEKKLIASGSQPEHDVYYPLTLFTAKGEDVQHQNSTGFYNNSEVFEIAERVSELQKSWPKAWGTLDENSIGVVSPYVDQVARIRSELRKRKMHRVSVERVFNVQGKQFRVIILSTVRTRRTCSMDNNMDEVDYGFLSNVKLLNTAITRAQSLVAVVGDPVSLCTIGKCRKVWESFLEICHKNNSMYGMTWSQVRSQLDGVELKKTYVLNPLAPEFIPNRLRHGSTPQPPLGYGPYGYIYTPAIPHMYRQNFGYPNMATNPYMQPYMQQMCPPLPFYSIPWLAARYMPYLTQPPPHAPPPQPTHPPHPKMAPPKSAGMGAQEIPANPTSSAVTTNTNYTLVSVNQLTNTSDAEPIQASGTQGKVKQGNKANRDFKAATKVNNHIVAASSNLVHNPRPVLVPNYQNQGVHPNYPGLQMMPMQPGSWPEIPGQIRQPYIQQPAVRHQPHRNKSGKHDHRAGADLNKMPQNHANNNRLSRKFEDTMVVDSPHLQREMYSYILQRDGPEAAYKFMETLQSAPKAPQSYEGEPLFKHHAKMTNVNVHKEASLKEGIPIVQSGIPRHDNTKPKNKSPIRALYRKEGSVTVSVSQGDTRQRVRHSSHSSGESDSQVTWQRPKEPSPFQSVPSEKDFQRFPNAFAHFDPGNDFKMHNVNSTNGIGNGRSRPPHRNDPSKTNSATVNVANFLEPEKPPSILNDDRLGFSEYLDPVAPNTVDHYVRFLEENNVEDSHSPLEQSRFFPQTLKTNSSGNLTTAGAVPTYAGILRGEGSKTPGRMRHTSAPQSLYSSSANVFGPSGATTPRGSRVFEPLSSQHSSSDLFETPSNLGLDVNTDFFNRIPPSYDHSSHSSLNHDQVEEDLLRDPQEDVMKDPLELLKNIDFKIPPSTQALYQYFQ